MAQALLPVLTLFLRLTGSGLLGSLQRIQRGRSGKATTLARWFLCFQDHDITILRAGYRAFHQQQIVVVVDAADLQVAHRDLVNAHVAGHAHSRKYTRRERRSANRALHLEHVSVRAGTAAKVMTFYDAGKAAPLA